MSISNDDLILNTLKHNNSVRTAAYSNTLQAFTVLKDSIKLFVQKYNQKLIERNCDPLMDFNERGMFETELRVDSDLIVFTMHSNIFEFGEDHIVKKSSYVEKDPDASYCGVINIYNFLADSFRFDRLDDLGFLIGRVFINKDNHFYVEGKRQLGFLYTDFMNNIFNEEAAHNLIESSVLFSADFDLMVPEYEDVSVISVAQMKENISNSRIKTAKRLGFKFKADNDH